MTAGAPPIDPAEPILPDAEDGDGASLIGPGGKVDPDAVRIAADGDDDALQRVRFTLTRDLNKRLDKYLTDRIAFMSRNQLQRLIDLGAVTVNGRAPKASTNLRLGDVVDVVLPPPPATEIQGDDIPLAVLFEDAHLIVLNKAPDIIVHPARGHHRGTMLNALVWHLQHASPSGGALSTVGDEFARPGVIHRLDRDTSGLVIVAKTTAAYDALRVLFETREIEKYYWAVTKGAPRTPQGLIRRPILEYDGKVPGDTRTKKLAKVGASGKPALTAYRVLQANDHSALIECRAVTGRLHQIRVHLESIGCAILGDAFYAPSAARQASARLALHAHRIAFDHPITGKRVDVHTPWPSDLRSLLKRLKLDRPDLPSHPQHANQPPDDPIGDEEPPVGE